MCPGVVRGLVGPGAAAARVCCEHDSARSRVLLACDVPHVNMPANGTPSIHGKWTIYDCKTRNHPEVCSGICGAASYSARTRARYSAVYVRRFGFGAGSRTIPDSEILDSSNIITSISPPSQGNPTTTGVSHTSLTERGQRHGWQ